MLNDSYIDDDCIIKDETFLAFKNLLMCNICNKILKEPMMCKNCQKVFCKTCIEKNKKCECSGTEFVENQDKYMMLKMIKYLCRNCKEEVKYDDVEKHLGNGCETRENEPRLADCIYKKHELKKLTDDEIKEVRDKGQQIYHLSGKKIFYLYYLNI